MATGGSKKAIVAALLANLGIAVAKFVGFLITRASSMLAESVHSLADSGNQGLLLFGANRATRAATPEHPFGYGRLRYFWSFVVAVVLFALGSLFSLFEGVHKLAHPEPIESVGVAVAILVVSIGLETLSFRTAIVEANHVRRGVGWWAFIRHAKVPELPVVLLEDLGALVGLILALTGVALTAITGNPVWDAYGTLSIGVLLGIIAAILAVEMHSLLIGESAAAADVRAIRAAIEGCDGVVGLLHLKTQHLGPEELLVAGKVQLDPQLSFPRVVDTIDAAEARVRQAVPSARVMYLEPDVAAPVGA
ncbi:MAG: cation diffusion facilitator family transporter [Actinomycetota bacterium]|nr:cation diffusion facilitator family transporter [Actinomycetota bacterium]